MAGRPDPIVPAHLLHSSLPQPISDVIMQALSYGENQRFKSAAAMRQALNAAVGNLRYQAVATTAFLPAQGNTPTPAKGVAAPTSVTQPIAQSPSASATKLSATEITPTPATNPSVPLAKKQPKVGASFSSCLIVVLIGIGIVAGVVYGLQQAVSGGITMATSAFTPPPTATPSAVQALASFSSRNIDQLALIDQCSGDSMDGVLDVVVSEPSKRLFTASRDGRIRAWSLQPCTFQQRFVGHNGAVTALALTPDGSTLVSGGEDGTVRIWRIRDGALLETLQGHTAAITDLVVNVNGSRIFSVSSDNQLRRWNVDPPSADGDPISFAQGLLAVAVSSSDLVAVAGSDAIVYTLGVDGNQRDQFNGHTEPINALALSPDSTILASGSGAIIFPKDSTVRLWNVVDGSVRTFEGHTAAVQAVGFSADGQFLVSAGDDKSIRVWQIRDGTIQTMLTHHGAAVTTAFFTSDQHMLITGSLDGTVAIWGIAQ
jgi:WD40 repeat protein